TAPASFHVRTVRPMAHKRRHAATGKSQGTVRTTLRGLLQPVEPPGPDREKAAGRKSGGTTAIYRCGGFVFRRLCHLPIRGQRVSVATDRAHCGLHKKRMRCAYVADC